MAWIIFLIETRHYHELNKIGITSFGSTIYEIHIFESIYKSVKRIKTKNEFESYSTSWAGPNRSGGPQTRASDASAAQTRRSPGPAPALGTTTDVRDPRNRETDRGGEGDGGVARRRWLLRRGQRCYDVCLARAHLAVSSIAAITAATEVGDEHGGTRPRHGRLRRDDGVAAPNGDPTSFSSAPRT